MYGAGDVCVCVVCVVSVCVWCLCVCVASGAFVRWITWATLCRGDFDRFWFFWFLGVVVAVLSGCCAPHQRKIVINRKDDDGYIEGARV